MKITTDQIRAIQAILSYQCKDREEKLAVISNYLGREVKSTKDLTFIEAKELLHSLNGDKRNKENWGAFEKENPKHKIILSQLYTAGWTKPHTRHIEVPDIERLSDFLKSNKSPVNKPLKDMNLQELEKIIKAFKGIIKSIHK